MFQTGSLSPLLPHPSWREGQELEATPQWHGSLLTSSLASLPRANVRLVVDLPPVYVPPVVRVSRGFDSEGTPVRGTSDPCWPGEQVQAASRTRTVSWHPARCGASWYHSRASSRPRARGPREAACPPAFRTSPRTLPLNDSVQPFSHGVPGSMWRAWPPASRPDFDPLTSPFDPFPGAPYNPSLLPEVPRD